MTDIRTAQQLIERTETYARRTRKRPETQPVPPPRLPAQGDTAEEARIGDGRAVELGQHGSGPAPRSKRHDSEGLAFPGYPYLPNSRCGGKYRSFSETIAGRRHPGSGSISNATGETGPEK